ncbi:MAG: VIT1/CCC1 transporter family protein [Acidimicrobiales bacterium]
MADDEEHHPDTGQGRGEARAPHDVHLLQREHTPEAVRRRLARPNGGSHLRDFVYGAIDGTVTTFAVVSGVAGARLSATVVVILGVANLVADGFSMAVSNFLGSRAEEQQQARARREEQRHLDLVPEGEREEIRQIFAAKGFRGEQLERTVEVITGDRRVWLDTMMTEELGYAQRSSNPVRAAATTFVAFVAVGSLPLLVFLYDLAFTVEVAHPFAWSAGMTAVGFFAVGALKSRFVDQRWWTAGLETLAVGAVAAGLAFALGAALQGVA